MKYIIINADDFGLHKSIDEGIINLIKHDKISDLSVMPSGDSFYRSKKKLKLNGITNVGVHLTLVGNEKSISKSNLFTNGANNDYRFFEERKNIFLTIIFNYKQSLYEIKKEFDAQIKEVLSSGLKITHLDTHQHLHLFPPIGLILIDLAKKYSIRFIRIPTINNFKNAKINLLVYGVVKIFSQILKRNANNNKIQFISFTGFNESGILSKQKFYDLISNIKNKYTEIMCHP